MYFWSIYLVIYIYIYILSYIYTIHTYIHTRIYKRARTYMFESLFPQRYTVLSEVYVYSVAVAGSRVTFARYKTKLPNLFICLMISFKPSIIAASLVSHCMLRVCNIIIFLYFNFENSSSPNSKRATTLLLHVQNYKYIISYYLYEMQFTLIIFIQNL